MLLVWRRSFFMHRLLKHHLLPSHLGISYLSLKHLVFVTVRNSILEEMAQSCEIQFSFLKFHQMNSCVCNLANEQHKAKNALAFPQRYCGVFQGEHRALFPQVVNYLISVNCLLSKLYKQLSFIALQGDTARCYTQCRKYITMPVAPRLKKPSTFFSFKNE